MGPGDGRKYLYQASLHIYVEVLAVLLDGTFLLVGAFLVAGAFLAAAAFALAGAVVPVTAYGTLVSMRSINNQCV